MELPLDFCHEPPEGYRYETDQYRRNIVSIWFDNTRLKAKIAKMEQRSQLQFGGTQRLSQSGKK